MQTKLHEDMIATIKEFRLPRYQEIPDVGLYLNQVCKYINSYLATFTHMEITESMISNYVKKHLIANPVKKLYYREQIAYLFFIAIAKSVLSQDDFYSIICLQKKTYSCPVAYEYFCKEFENVLQYVFGLKESMENVGQDKNDVKFLFRNVIVTAAHKIYLDSSFAVLSSELKKTP